MLHEVVESKQLDVDELLFSNKNDRLAQSMVELSDSGVVEEIFEFPSDSEMSID